MSAPIDLSAVPGQIKARAATLGTALAAWATRDDTKAQPGVREAANTAMTALDAMLAVLHAARSQLVSEIRVSDDATMARTTTLLARLRAEREDGAR